jgi:hypothetical protein
MLPGLPADRAPGKEEDSARGALPIIPVSSVIGVTVPDQFQRSFPTAIHTPVGFCSGDVAQQVLDSASILSLGVYMNRLT